VSVWEVEFKVRPLSVVSSGTWSGGRDLDGTLAWDGNATTRWASNDDGKRVWIQFDLGEFLTLEELFISWETTGPFSVLGSADGIQFHRLYQNLQNTNQKQDKIRFSSLPNHFRWVKIEALPESAGNPRYYRSIFEVSFTTKASTLNQKDIIDGETNLGIVRDWPQIPAGFQMPDYSLLASKYEQLTFINNDGLTHLWDWGMGSHFRDLTLRQPGYFLVNKWGNPGEYITQSTVLFPGLLSSAARGTNMTNVTVNVPPTLANYDTSNLVRMMKAYYHEDPLSSPRAPNGIFTDHFHDHLKDIGDEFWFTLLPTVNALQLQSLYS